MTSTQIESLNVFEKNGSLNEDFDGKKWSKIKITKNKCNMHITNNIQQITSIYETISQTQVIYFKKTFNHEFNYHLTTIIQKYKLNN